MTSPPSDPAGIGSAKGAPAANATERGATQDWEPKVSRDLRALGVGWTRSREEVVRGFPGLPAGPRHGPGPRPARPWLSPPGARRHAQERETTQVPGPRRLLRPSDCGRLCQLGSGSREVWKSQKSCCQCYSAGRVGFCFIMLSCLLVKSLCGLEASQVPTEEVFSGAGEPCDSSDEMDAQEESTHEQTISRKKKSKRHKEDPEGAVGEEYPMDIWLLLASYIRPEDIAKFSLICKNAWTVTCTAAFWTRLYRSIACVGHWSRCDGSRSICPLKPSPLFLMEQQDVQGMSEGQDSQHGGRPTPYPLGVSAFLVQKDCWEQTRTNVGI
ncbi:transmembrane protein 183A isoform X7 [Monodelphis domestica]|uniref:transmembrane protein 183A isoform X7 n=1 Tax=Monodelphis domestica TaxID=13616 RepID=UPI0007B4017A|nr:transmembrane protein 183A isoform X7 [Monodelphis domestica]